MPTPIRKTLCRFGMTEQEKKARQREQVRRAHERRYAELQEYNRRLYIYKKEIQALSKISI